MEINKIDSIYLTRQNLRLLLGVKRRTLDYRIASLIKKNILSPLKKGFYLNLNYFDRSSNKMRLLEYLGQIMVYPSYLSLEYVLAERGFLAESVYTLTYITSKKTRKISTPISNFVYRNIKESLYFGFTQEEVDQASYYKASFAKALFDLIYLSSWEGDRQRDDFLLNSRFNWNVFKTKDKIEFKKIITTAKIKKMTQVYKFLKQKKLI